MNSCLDKQRAESSSNLISETVTTSLGGGSRRRGAAIIDKSKKCETNNSKSINHHQPHFLLYQFELSDASKSEFSSRTRSSLSICTTIGSVCTLLTDGSCKKGNKQQITIHDRKHSGEVKHNQLP